MRYTHAAIPTEYRGRRYRSRLEARWAAFFDALGWQHEYEPFDLGAWSPDFQIVGGPNHFRLLVEVKPVTEFDRATADKMARAAHAAGRHVHEDYLLLLGVAPRMMVSADVSALCRNAFRTMPRQDTPAVRLGWEGRVFDDGQHCWDEVFACWRPLRDQPTLAADMLSVNRNMRTGLPSSWFASLSADCGDEIAAGTLYAEHTMRLWAEASNAVQWKGPGA